MGDGEKDGGWEIVVTVVIVILPTLFRKEGDGKNGVLFEISKKTFRRLIFLRIFPLCNDPIFDPNIFFAQILTSFCCIILR